jgi:hypothetical protein
MENIHDSIHSMLSNPYWQPRLPGGASWSAEGTNFSVFSHDARNMELRLYEVAESGIEIQLPDIAQRQWHLAIDTSAPYPNDILDQARQRAADRNIQRIQARSVVVFQALEIKSSTSLATQLPKH